MSKAEIEKQLQICILELRKGQVTLQKIIFTKEDAEQGSLSIHERINTHYRNEYNRGWFAHLDDSPEENVLNPGGVTVTLIQNDGWGIYYHQYLKYKHLLKKYNG